MAFGRSIHLSLVGLAMAVFCLGSGCSRTKKPDQRIPIGTWYTVRDIVSDDTGAWIAIEHDSPFEAGKKLPPLLCSVCRYGVDGTLQKEVSLGEGVCRQLKYTPYGFLALVVPRENLRIVLWISDREGTVWSSRGELPCEPYAANRLKDGSILIWDDLHLFRSYDDGATWQKLPLAIPSGVEKGLSRETVICELPDGRLLLATRVYEGEATSTIRIGTYSEKENFHQLLTINGRLAGSSVQTDGSVMLLVHEENAGDTKEVLYLLNSPASAAPSLSVVYRTSSMLPRELITRGQSAIVFSTIWKTPTSFFSTFSRRILSVRKGPDGRWLLSENRSLESYEPQLLSTSPNGDAWIYVSNWSGQSILYFAKGI
jgi:hypothetical protein